MGPTSVKHPLRLPQLAQHPTDLGRQARRRQRPRLASPGSGTPEVPALPHRSLVPPPAAEPEVRLCGSGQLKGGLRVLRGPRSQRGRGCWALACGAGSGFGVPTPRLPLPGPFAPAPSENLPPSPGEESHVLQSAPSVALIRGPSEGAPAPAGRRRRLWSHRSPVWEGREAPSQERPSPRNALENNPDPASCPKPVALSSPAQGRCWGLGDGPVCARESGRRGERGRTAPEISKLPVPFLCGPSRRVPRPVLASQQRPVLSGVAFQGQEAAGLPRVWLSPP